MTQYEHPHKRKRKDQDFSLCHYVHVVLLLYHYVRTYILQTERHNVLLISLCSCCYIRCCHVISSVCSHSKHRHKVLMPLVWTRRHSGKLYIETKGWCEAKNNNNKNHGTCICLYFAYHLICFSWLCSGLLLLASDVKWTLSVKASTQCCLSQT